MKAVVQMLNYHKYIRNPVSLCIFSALLISACNPAAKIGEDVRTGKLTDGVYEGSFRRFPNAAKVKVTIREQKIAQIEILNHAAWRGKKAEDPVTKAIIEKQSTNVDAVSGATNSSHVIMNAVRKAIEKSLQAKTKN